MLSKQPKVALVHDDFLQAGGAESLFATIASMWPSAPIYTSLVNWGKIPAAIDKDRIRTSWMQKIPFATKLYKALLPLYPLVFESFNLDSYDLVISSTTRFSKSIITKPETTHVSYVNSLPRFIWDTGAGDDYLWPIVKKLLKPYLSWLKKWDAVSSSRVDFYIANSKNVARKIKQVYKRESQVIYPFADTNFFTPAKIHNWTIRNKNYYLVVSRLVKWKKIESVIKAASELRKNLIIVGDGPDKKRLKSLARLLNANVEFKGRVSLHELRELYNNCKALIITQQEDFGIAAVEAQSCGKPVIAFSGGGVKEIIINFKTGMLFNKQSTNSLKDAIEKSHKLKWNDKSIRNNALRFSKSKFENNLRKTVESYVKANTRS